MSSGIKGKKTDLFHRFKKKKKKKSYLVSNTFRSGGALLEMSDSEKRFGEVVSGQTLSQTAKSCWIRLNNTQRIH